MNLSEKNTITESINKIKGAKFIKIGRTADLIWIAMKGIDGKDYALHMQTFFRFCNNEKVLITDMDKYQPISSMTENENFNWDVQGANMFDKWVASNKNDLLNDFIVQKIKITEFGDLVIIFDKSITLTVYLEVTNDTECWRFFEKGNDEKYDLVVLGNCINVDLPK